MSKKPFKNLSARLNVETLENRVTPTCNVISGYVYYDLNNNGLFDSGESPIADTPIELRDAMGTVVGSTTTDSTGFYQFDTDMAHPGTDATLVKTVTFDPTQTNFSLSGLLDQFDPSLGQLESIEIQHDGSITSEIKAENFSSTSDSNITGTVSGTLSLSGPGGLSNVVNIAGAAGSFHATQYDGVTDFDGSSGGTFGTQTANGSNTIVLTGSDMDEYIGTGQVSITETSDATSDATGGGNLDVQVRSTAQSTVTVTYHYKQYDCLAPGDYTIVETQQPSGYGDGLESMDGVVDPNSVGTDTIAVTLNGVDLPNNNFGEVMLTQISGHVWHDANNDGILDPTEDLIPGVQITLDTAAGPMVTTTDANGFYSFVDLQPGTYTLHETQPANYLDGKDNAGTVNGVQMGSVVNDPAEDQIQSITLNGNESSENNDFGEIKPSSIAGHVWFDANKNGVRDATEAPIPGTTVTLTGFDDQGPVSLSMPTNANGEYKFENLRPGTYALQETQPVGFNDGQDNIGTPGGTPGNDNFSDIVLPEGFDGVDNDFGEVRPDTPTPPNPIPKAVGPLGMLPAISKAQMTSIPTWSNVDPVFRGQMAFVVGATITATGQQLDLIGTMSGVNALRNGTTPTAFVSNLWASDAHRALQVSNLYHTILNRAPTAAEIATTKQQLNTGTDTLDVMQSLYTSNEFQTLHATTDELATALSEKILSVTPGSAQLQAIVQSMANDPLDQVVHDLLHSNDGLANLVDDSYLETLRRHPSASESQSWVAQLQANTITLDALTQKLLTSAEFYQLAFANIH
jgi:hypothetical protein